MTLQTPIVKGPLHVLLSLPLSGSLAQLLSLLLRLSLLLLLPLHAPDLVVARIVPASLMVQTKSEKEKAPDDLHVWANTSRWGLMACTSPVLRHASPELFAQGVPWKFWGAFGKCAT